MNADGSRLLRAARLSSVPGLHHGFEIGLAAAPGLARELGRQRVAQSLSSCGQCFFLRQVHADSVVEAPWEGTPDGDAGLAWRAGDIVAVETADCVPILLADPETRLAAAVHAGWRGAAHAIARMAVEALAARGARPERIVAAVGPCIGACCYEVGPELRARFEPEAQSFFRPAQRDRFRLDLRGLVQRQLESVGVLQARIDHVALCTSCAPARLPSYRRDGPACGRIVSFVGWGSASTN